MGTERPPSCGHYQIFVIMIELCDGARIKLPATDGGFFKQGVLVALYQQYFAVTLRTPGTLEVSENRGRRGVVTFSASLHRKLQVRLCDA